MTTLCDKSKLIPTTLHMGVVDPLQALISISVPRNSNQLWTFLNSLAQIFVHYHYSMASVLNKELRTDY